MTDFVFTQGVRWKGTIFDKSCAISYHDVCFTLTSQPIVYKEEYPMPNLAIRSMIGFIQGILLVLLSEHIKPQQADYSILMSVMTVIIFIPPLVVQSIGNLRMKTLLRWATCAASMIFGISYYSIFRESFPHSSSIFSNTIPFTVIFFIAVSLFIAHALILSGDSDKQVFAKYSTYFDIAWKLTVQVVFTAFFLQCFWGLLFLGIGLFDIIHLNFFNDLITNKWFATPASTLVIAIAIHITDVGVGIVRGIRNLILALLSWLLPVMTAISGTFLLCLFYTGLTLLWKTGFAGILLLVTDLVLIILINAAYQSGENTLHGIQRFFASLACCLLTPIIALAIYALYLRVEQYGWSVRRIDAAACILIIGTYAIGYTLAVFIPGKKLRGIEVCNIANACLMLAVFIALFTPIADPARLAVASQMSRLETGKVLPEKFDFKALQMEGARFGHQALQTLATTWQGPKADFVHAQAKLALESKQYENKQNSALDANAKLQKMTIHTKDGKLPMSFLNQTWAFYENNIVIPQCLREGRNQCDIWMVKGSNNADMILVLSNDDVNNNFTGFQQDADKKWVAIGRWRLPYKCHETIRAAMNGKFKLVNTPPPEPDIEIMGWHARFEQNESMNVCK